MAVRQHISVRPYSHCSDTSQSRALSQILQIVMSREQTLLSEMVGYSMVQPVLKGHLGKELFPVMSPSKQYNRNS